MFNLKSSISLLIFGIAITLLNLASCSGSSGGGSVGSGSNNLSGVASVGAPIVGGIVKVICSSGSTIAPITTSSSGQWSTSLTGQTLPCAIQVSGGTINGAANTAVYHSIAVSPGTANITSLTDLLVANLVSNPSPSNWFAALNASQGSVSAITQTRINTSLAQLSTALSALTLLSSTNPITTPLTPGSTSNNMLTALGNSLSSTNTSYSTLLNSVATSTPVPPALNSAIAAAYTNIVSCSSTGDTSAITLSVVPSVAGGVAPLAVFFDATATTATTTTRPFHDLQYSWTFGDPASGVTWANGSYAGHNLKNAATGPVAAHVFETPSPTTTTTPTPYTVAVTVTDGTNTVRNTCTLITVNDPNVIFAGANTICVAATTASQNASSGCPVGASSVVQSDFPTAINTYAQTGKRVLFNRGDTFNVGPTNADITQTGPGIIGAYGPFTSANPIVVSTQKVPLLSLSSASTPGIADWRIMDLEFNGSNAGANNTGISAAGTINQVLILRMNIHNTYGGVLFGADILDYWNSSSNINNHGHTMFEQLTIVDSSITTQTGGLGMTGVFIEANRYAMLGTLIDDTTGIEHVSRYPYLNKAIISNNTLSRPSGQKHVIKLHAPVWCQVTSGQPYYQPVCNYATDTKPTTGVENTSNGTSYTQYVVISDNKLVPASGVAITVNVAPFSSFADNRLKDILFERNWLTAISDTTNAVNIQGQEMTFRNNILDMSGANTFRTIFQTIGGGSVPPDDNIRIFNNTTYASDASSGSVPVILVYTASSTTNLSVINNLMYFPLSPRGGSIIWSTTGPGCAGTACDASNNTTNALTSPLFTNPNPLIPSDFKPTAGSYAIGTGASIPVWSDFFQKAEPASSVMGAIVP